MWHEGAQIKAGVADRQGNCTRWKNALFQSSSGSPPSLEKEEPDSAIALG